MPEENKKESEKGDSFYVPGLKYRIYVNFFNRHLQITQNATI